MLQTAVRPAVDAFEPATQPSRRPEFHRSSESSERFEETLRRASAAAERDSVAGAREVPDQETETARADGAEDGKESRASGKDAEAGASGGPSRDGSTQGAKDEKDTGAEKAAEKKADNANPEEEQDSDAKSVARDKQGNAKPVSRRVQDSKAEATTENDDSGESHGATAAAETESDAAPKDAGPARAQGAGAQSTKDTDEAEESGRAEDAADATRAAGGRTAPATENTATGETATAKAARAQSAAAEASVRDGEAEGKTVEEGERNGSQRRVIVVDARGGSSGDEGGSRREATEQGNLPRQQGRADAGMPKGETETLRVANQVDLPQSGGRPAQTAAPTPFRDVYSGFLRQMRAQGNAEVVRQSTVVLRNADSGEIRLVLKPESLGEVRIRVQLQDNHIAGRIVVENNSVREMFQENLDALARAFRESGYETGSLDVEVRDRGGDGRRRQAGSMAGSRLVRELEESVPSLASVGDPESLVDVFV